MIFISFMQNHSGSWAFRHSSNVLKFLYFVMHKKIKRSSNRSKIDRERKKKAQAKQLARFYRHSFKRIVPYTMHNDHTNRLKEKKKKKNKERKRKKKKTPTTPGQECSILVSLG